MSLETRELAPIGVEVVDVDPSQLLRGETTPAELMDLLEARSVVVFRSIGLTDAEQVALARRLGPVVVRRAGSPGRDEEFPEIFRVSLDRSVNDGVYMRATVCWHIDGTTDEIPTKASLLSAHRLADSGGDTQFVSTYEAYERLRDDEKARFATLRVWHSVEAVYRAIDPDPAPEVLERLRAMPQRLHPLVWTHRSGRKSLVLGSTASYIEGMDREEGAALLAELLARATEPSRVYEHHWELGDLIIWDNRGTLHRVTPYHEDSGREMHRVTLEGDEPIE